MLIDCSYFTKGPRLILNASMGNRDTLPNPNAAEVNKAIEAYIEEHQERFLVRILGATLGNKVNAYLVCQDEDENPTSNMNFDAICERLREPFADYVFYYILRDSAAQATITGLVRLKCANDYVAPIRRQVSAWNSMVDKNRLFAQWCQSADCPIAGISTSEDMTTKINSLNL